LLNFFKLASARELRFPITAMNASTTNFLARPRETHWLSLFQAVTYAGLMGLGCGGTVDDGAGNTVGGAGNMNVGGSATGGGAGSGCYSPTQNLSTAYQVGAQGCACNSATDASVCVQGVALICESNVWMAVEDGPCMPMPGTGGTGNIGGNGAGGSGATGGKACGARAGDTCAASEYCAYQAGQYCGQADAEAFCKPRPMVCTDLYAPVCGCNGITYANPCAAAADGSGVYASGVCIN
jgi:hypothetical protein